jgi:NAD(P)-dependent dehydrogenase (short-subunit alcohol dehydrogenase family)
MAFDEAVATGQAPLLHDKVAVITGVGAGIGRSAARLFQAAGAQVVGSDLDSELGPACADELGIEVCLGDVTNQNDIDALIQTAIDQYGRIDILFNNAGVGILSDGPVPVHETTDAIFDRTLAVNLRGTFLACRSVLPHMMAKGGAIVNAASIFGLVTGAGTLSYSTSKAAVLGLTRTIAVDYAEHGVRCNALCPGFIHTQMVTDLLDTVEDPESTLKTLREAHPVKRLGQPDEVAAAALWLCSDAASFVTGAAILVDGGYTAV